MMYQEKFVVAIKHNGRVLREFKDVAYLPFGQEYSIFLKNLNNRRAIVTVSIDGTDIGDGTRFIINANDELELKRFVRNGNLTEGNAFKFIERTESIEEHRGIKAEDGIVRIEFQYEREIIHNNPVIINHPIYRGWPQHYHDSWFNSTTYGTTDIRANSVGASGASGQSMSTTATTASAATSEYSAKNGEFSEVNTAYNAQAESLNDAGITVPGSKVEQKFTAVYGFNAEIDTHVIVLRLVGETAENKPVVKSVTVKTKQECSSCGKINKATSKFCSSCGIALILI